MMGAFSLVPFWIPNSVHRKKTLAVFIVILLRLISAIERPTTDSTRDTERPMERVRIGLALGSPYSWYASQRLWSNLNG